MGISNGVSRTKSVKYLKKLTCSFVSPNTNGLLLQFVFCCIYFLLILAPSKQFLLPKVMQIHKFHEYKSHYEKDVIEGRWYWAQTVTYTWEDPVPIDLLPPLKYPNSPSFYKIFDPVIIRPTRWKGIKWTDLFDKHPIIDFTFNKEWHYCSILPLCRRFLLAKLKNGNLQIVELDWTKKECLVGARFSAFDQSLENLKESVLIDPSLYLNGEVQFLLYAVEDQLVHCLHCRVDCATRRIETIGEKFEFPQKEFNFTDLRTNILRGLSTTKGTVTQFDLRLRQKLVSIELKNLPVSISQDVVAWSHNRLFLTKTIKNGEVGINTTEYGNWKIKTYCSTIYNVDLESGNTTIFSYTFDGHVKKMEIGLDDRLYLFTKKLLLERSAIRTKGGEVLGMAGHLTHYQQFRVPFRQPESLFLLAVSAFFRPIPLVAYKMIRKRDDVPANLCKC